MICTAKGAPRAPGRGFPCTSERCAPVNSIHQLVLRLRCAAAITDCWSISGDPIGPYADLSKNSDSHQAFDHLFDLATGNPALFGNESLSDWMSIPCFHSKNEREHPGHHVRKEKVITQEIVDFDVFLCFVHSVPMFQSFSTLPALRRL